MFSNFFRIPALLTLLLSITSIDVFSSTLLAEDQLDVGNYTAVHIWNHKLKGGHSVGHAAVEIYKDNAQYWYGSLFPEERSVEVFGGTVQPSWHAFEQDCKDGVADTVIRLYSLRHARDMEQEKKQAMYTLLGNGGSSPFSNDLHSTNCAGFVRNILIAGGVPELFKQKSATRYLYIVPGVISTVGGVALGLGGGALGSVVGFFKGIFRLSNPLYAAWDGTKQGAYVLSSPLINIGTRSFSRVNNGHPCIESEIVTPFDVLSLAEEARQEEIRLFPKSSGWVSKLRFSKDFGRYIY